MTMPTAPKPSTILSLFFTLMLAMERISIAAELDMNLVWCCVGVVWERSDRVTEVRVGRNDLERSLQILFL